MANHGAITPSSANAAILLEKQRAAFAEEGFVTAATRIDRLSRAIDLLVTHKHRFCEALAHDYGVRPAGMTLMADIFPAVQSLRHARRYVRRWMRPQRVATGVPLAAPGTKSEIIYQPVGSVGIISPWNFPIELTFVPLAGVLAAGNRCLIKPSEVTAATSNLMQELVAKYFDPAEVSVICGDPEVAAAFSRLPFDHLVFTGSTEVGYKVMAAAAQNLVPVTLELGGKCPVIISDSAKLERSVNRILLSKLINAGQLCIAADYLFVPRKNVEPFVDTAKKWFERAYPNWATNPDYPNIVSARHAKRARELLADSIAKGGRAVPLSDTPSGLDERRFVPTLVFDVTEDMRVMQEEIFSPVLPVIPYDRLDEPLKRINRGARPLAVYYFGRDKRELQEIISRTVSGAVTINDVAAHVLVNNLPFGGVGASGMGTYHGEFGFKQFSHPRAIFKQTGLDTTGFIGLRPPYGARLRRFSNFFLRK